MQNDNYSSDSEQELPDQLMQGPPEGYEEQPIFDNRKYLFLFAEEMGFDKDASFNINEELPVESLLQIKTINRRHLRSFIISLKTNQSASTVLQQHIPGDFDESASDELIKETMDSLLTLEELGPVLPVETVSHYEYFNNTLNMFHKASVSNPFDKPNSLKALSYITPIIEVQNKDWDDLVDVEALEEDEIMTPVNKGQ
jgi:hypothetical protein